MAEILVTGNAGTIIKVVLSLVIIVGAAMLAASGMIGHFIDSTYDPANDEKGGKDDADRE